MKTIDLLVEELPKRGGWPEKVTHIGQDYDRELMFYGRGNVRTGIILDQLAVDHRECGSVGTKITREQYEASLAAKNEGWIEWGGGECPVPGDTDVLIKCKSEGAWDCRRKQRADEVSWTHDDSALDVIAYRLHQPQEAEQAKADEEADLNECIGQDAAPLWNGEGLPPVGVEIEYSFAKVNYRTDFSRGKVLAYGMQNVFMEHWASKNEFIQPLDKIEFRPIRSEADRKRDEAVEAIDRYMPEFIPDTPNDYYNAKKIYDAIAAGKIPGVKLED